MATKKNSLLDSEKKNTPPVNPVKEQTESMIDKAATARQKNLKNIKDVAPKNKAPLVQRGTAQHKRMSVEIVELIEENEAINAKVREYQLRIQANQKKINELHAKIEPKTYDVS